MIKAGKTFTGTGPYEISRQLLDNADKALAYLNTIDASGETELVETVADIKAMALLSQYYGHKIAGATRLHLYQEMGEPADQKKTVDALGKASRAWRNYVANVVERYENPQWLGRIHSGPFDYNQITQWVDDDIKLARNTKN